MPTIGDNTGNTYSGTEDNSLRENNPTQNRGANAAMGVNKIAAGNHYHSLLSFSGVSNLPSSLTVTSAIISLYLVSASGSAAQTHSFRRLLRNWGELTSNWNTYDGTTNWTTGGALDTTNDRSSTVSDTITGITNTTGYYHSNDAAQIQADFEDFADGTLSNYGHHIERTDGADDSTTRDYTTSDGTDGQRPYVTIIYTTGGATIPVLAYHHNHNIGSHL